MSNIKQRLDGVITNVHRKLANSEFIPPIKTDKGILVGNILIVPNGTQKDLYRNNQLIYQGIFLNKCAIKIANLVALNKDPTRVNMIHTADQKFGQALVDYQVFKDKLIRAKQNNDQFRVDLYLARMTYARDCYEHHKKLALALAA